MEKKVDSNASSSEKFRATKLPVILDSDLPSATPIGFGLLPPNISHIVGNYLSSAKTSDERNIFLGEEHITLCLSQSGTVNLGSCWYLGLLSPQDRWESLNFKVDRQCVFKHPESCLNTLMMTKSKYCRVVVDVLVITLDVTLNDSPNALVDLRNTIRTVQGCLSSVKQVVIAMENYAFCCFSLQDTIDKVTGFSRPVDRQQGLSQIVDDLDTVYQDNHGLTVRELFAFYLKNDITPASAMYLVKFVILLDHQLNLALFKDEVFNTISSKLMWVYLMESLHHVEQDTARLCHAVHMVTSTSAVADASYYSHCMEHAFCHEDNPLIERIVINSGLFGRVLHLPRPRTPLTDTTPRSALIELTLEGDNNAIHLTDLNNDYFPNLTYLSIIGGKITGQLDSRYVPCLKTLVLEPGSQDVRSACRLGPLVNEHCQSIIRAGHPWQLVASHDQGGWSLASYDECTTNSLDDEKEGSPHSLPLIRELVLVFLTEKLIDEWQSLFMGNSPLQMAPANHSNPFLVLAPHNVQKITAFGVFTKSPTLEFKQPMPGETRILSSLTCHHVNAVLDGDVLQQLQAFEVNDADAALSGVFPQLRTLSFQDATLQSPWQIEALLLQTLNCHHLENASGLVLRLRSLLHLSFLKIKAWNDRLIHCPKILDDEKRLGFSCVGHVSLEGGVTLSPFFKQCRANEVSHLELTVNAWQLPACWSDTEWLCDTLKTHVYVSKLPFVHGYDEPDIVVLPLLPRVKTLTVTANDCFVLLDKEMRELTECTVTTPRMLGSKLKCPALKRIRFTGKLSESDKKQCLNPATYLAFCAQPRLVCFDFDGEMHRMTWDIAPNGNKILSLAGPLEEDDGSFVSCE